MRQERLILSGLCVIRLLFVLILMRAVINYEKTIFELVEFEFISEHWVC